MRNLRNPEISSEKKERERSQIRMCWRENGLDVSFSSYGSSARHVSSAQATLLHQDTTKSTKHARGCMLLCMNECQSFEEDEKPTYSPTTAGRWSDTVECKSLRPLIISEWNVTCHCFTFSPQDKMNCKKISKWNVGERGKETRMRITEPKKILLQLQHKY